MDKKNKTKIGRIQKAILYRTIIPMILMGIVIAGVVFYGYKNSVRSEIENSLMAVAAGTAGAYDAMYPGDYTMTEENKYITLYKGDEDITTYYDIIDRIKKETGMDVTLFYKDARIATTLQDVYGGRYLLTGIHAGVYNEVSKSKKPLCYLVDIDEVKYYACYLPLFNRDSTFVGMVATAVKQQEIDDEAKKAAFPIIVITIIAAIITSLVSFGYTNRLADSILKLRIFLGGMTGGKLDNDMPREVTARGDELGDTGKAVVDMQNAIRVLVERDPLTSLYNRRYGGARLRNIQRHANKCGMPYALCICDIDFFKKVNDTYGHDAGDVVLKRVADIMRKAMSGKGFAARWGGEEFLLVFDKIGMKDAVNELAKILDTIRKTDIAYGKLIIKITMSFGVVDGDQSDDYSDLLCHADERLYLAKTNGRNRIVSTDVIEDETATKSEENTVNNQNAEVSQPEHNTSSEETNENNGSGYNAEALKEDKFNSDNDIEFLTKLLDKMNEQLYKATVEENRED